MGALITAAAGVDWPTVLISLGGAGGLVALFRLRPQNAVDRATQQKMLAELQTSVLEDAKAQYEAQAEVAKADRERYDELARRLDQTRVELAGERAAGARKDLKIQILERRLEQLMDELAALRAQIGLGGRREDDDPHVEPPTL